MKERERIVVSGLVALMLLVWLGFAVHRAPQFAGSFWGGMLAISGSVLMLIPLLYLFVKRIPLFKRIATRWVSMRTMLTIHIYAGVLGPILVLLHTGHKFESVLGVALTGMTLIVVVSGFVGRYLLRFVSDELREKKTILTGLWKQYDVLAETTRKNPQDAILPGSMRLLWLRLLVSALGEDLSEVDIASVARMQKLTASIADVEYAISSHEALKRAFSLWLKCHIVISFVLYALLGLHIWAGIHFGLRWFE